MGQSIFSGSRLCSPNSLHCLIVARDHLEFIKNINQAHQTTVFEARRGKRTLAKLELKLQLDNNLVLYETEPKRRPLWHSETAGKASSGPADLFVTNWGAVQIRDPRGSVIFEMSGEELFRYDEHVRLDTCLCCCAAVVFPNAL